MPAPSDFSAAAARPSQCATRAADTSASTGVTCGAKRSAASSSRSRTAASVITGELGHPLLPGREPERRTRRVAVDEHVVHGRAGVHGQRVPDLEAAQQLDRARVQRVRAHVLAAERCRGLAAQRDREAEPGQGERQGLADDPAADDLHIEGRHRIDCRERSRDNRRLRRHHPTPP
jgi:hypothetical protein